MVGYGDALRKSQRPGWEKAYLDYDGLKHIRHQIEAVLVERDQELTARLGLDGGDRDITQALSFDEGLRKYHELRVQFSTKLHSEIEKISLFGLSRMGELAEAVGALRFRGHGVTTPRVSLDGGDAEDADENSRKTRISFEQDIETTRDGEAIFNFDELGGERATLLPASDKRSVVTASSSRRKSLTPSTPHLFSRSKLVTLLGRQFNEEKDKVGLYSDVGVELLHLLKYTCLNSVGIRKIVKKYEKLLNFYPSIKLADDKMRDEEVLLMPKEVARQFSTLGYARIDQLTNNKDFGTIFASLLDALADSEKSLSASVGMNNDHWGAMPVSFTKGALVKYLIDSNDSQLSLPLLRFECTMSSIHALMEFSNDVSRPFQVFLSKRAMISTGKDRGDVGNADKKALSLLLVFEPDFILVCIMFKMYQYSLLNHTSPLFLSSLFLGYEWYVNVKRSAVGYSCTSINLHANELVISSFQYSTSKRHTISPTFISLHRIRARRMVP